jgi:AcrR family transcriptional regulator
MKFHPSRRARAGALWQGARMNRSVPALPNRPATRAEQRDAARKSAMDAATEIFARHGFEGGSINDIASQSGVSKQNLLYHFASKEALWQACVDRLFAQVDAFMAEAFAPNARSDPPFAQFVEVYFEACCRFPAYVLIPMIEGVNAGWRTDYLAKTYLQRHIIDFNAYVKRMVKVGALPDIDPLHLQNAVAGGAQLYLALAPLWQSTLGVDTRAPEFLKQYADSFLRILHEVPRDNSAQA